MGLSMTGKCDFCGEKLDFDPAVVGSSPMRMTIEDVLLGTKREAIMCCKCWPRVKKGLEIVNYQINESDQTEPLDQPENDASSEAQPE